MLRARRGSPEKKSVSARYKKGQYLAAFVNAPWCLHFRGTEAGRRQPLARSRRAHFHTGHRGICLDGLALWQIQAQPKVQSYLRSTRSCRCPWPLMGDADGPSLVRGRLPERLSGGRVETSSVGGCRRITGGSGRSVSQSVGRSQQRTIRGGFKSMQPVSKGGSSNGVQLRCSVAPPLLCWQTLGGGSDVWLFGPGQLH